MRGSFLAVMMGAVALALGSSASQAYEVQVNGDTATGITNLVVDGTTYNVTFRYDTAENIYGAAPGMYEFDELTAEEARDSVVVALNSVPAVTNVGPDTSVEFNIGFGFENDFCLVQQGFYVFDVWILATDADIRLYLFEHTYADFELATPTEFGTWGRIKALYDQ